MGKPLSWKWRNVLVKLSDYDDDGVDLDNFCSLMGDMEPPSYSQPARIALDQMFFEGVGYWQSIGDTGRIRITKEGLKALSNES